MLNVFLDLTGNMLSISEKYVIILFWEQNFTFEGGITSVL